MLGTSNVVGFPILSTIAYLPLLGALLIMFFVDGKDEEVVRRATLATALVTMLASLVIVFKFQSGTPDFQFVEKLSWIDTLGVTYFVGVDGISMLLIVLATILSSIVVLSSWTAITHRVKEYFIFMLLLETGMIGVLMSLDVFLFYVFWEVMLVPMYFLIGVWGGERRLYAAIKFFLYTLAGSVLMLLGILTIYYKVAAELGYYSFSLLDWYSVAIPHHLQWWLFLSFFVGFAVKVPMFPFHTWLPDAHVQAPTAGSVILAGVLLKMGTYGFVRFSMPLLPWATVEFVPFMMVLSIVGIVYGALVAMVQKDMKKLVAYSSVSHLGFVMLGLYALNEQGITGGILQMINHGISTSGLFLCVGMIYERRHTRLISEFGGLSKQLPVFAVMFAIMTMSSIGLPGLNGFVGEFLILVGAFKANWVYAAWATSGIVLGAAYMLWLFQRVMFGPLSNPKNEKLLDLNFREIVVMLPLVAFAFWIGLYPKPFIKIMEPSVSYLVRRINPPAQDVFAAHNVDLSKGQVYSTKSGTKHWDHSDSGQGGGHSTPSHGGGHGTPSPSTGHGAPAADSHSTGGHGGMH